MKRRRLIISSIILAILLAGIAFPLGSLPPFATLFNPQTGIWAPGAPQSDVVLGQQSVTVSENGSTAQVLVDIDPNGFVRVASNQTWAMYL